MGFVLGLFLGICGVLVWHRYRTGLPTDVTIPLSKEFSPWQYVLQCAPIGYLQVDNENRLHWANPLLAKLLGITPVPSRLLLQLVRSYELDQIIQETRREQSPQEKSWAYHPVSPDPLQPQPNLHLRAFSIPLGQGHVGVFLEDRGEAIKLSQQRDRWTADVAHELKTPLTSMRLVVETLQDRSPGEIRPWLDRLLREVIRLSNIVEDLLDLGQQDMGKDPSLTLTNIDLIHLTQRVWQTLEPLASRKQIYLQYRGPDRLTMEGDEARLHRLFLNLLDNAIKFSPPCQSVRLEITPQGEEVAIDVIDCGSGFSEASLPFVFDRFYRADPSRSRPDAGVGGSGLGLAIVRQGVLLHGGTIRATNHPETLGAWISLTLPRSQEQVKGDKS